MLNITEQDVYRRITAIIRDQFNFTVESTEPNFELMKLGDLVLKFKDRTTVIIEIKNNINNSTKKNVIDRWKKGVFGVAYYVLTDGSNTYLYNESLLEININSSLNDVFEYILKKLLENYEMNGEKTITRKNDIVDIIKEAFRVNKAEFNFSNYDKLIEVDIEKRTAYFIEEVENSIFNYLLNDVEENESIFRYTSLDGMFASIYNKSIRMNGLVGMNDTTEVDYVENYLYNININEHKKHWKKIEEINSKFIISCSEKKDNLTLWRLYGDDFKGCSLELKINSKSHNFMIKKVHYASVNKKDDILEIFKQIYNEILLKYNVKFTIKGIDTWKHFFKPHEYSDEKEVRILYSGKEENNKKGWLLTRSHEILNPYMDFSINEKLPFFIKEILLGKKSTSCVTNEYQLKQLLRDLGLHHQIDVKLSLIENYR